MRRRPILERAGHSLPLTAGAVLLGSGLFLQLLVLAVLARDQVSPGVLLAWMAVCALCSLARVWALVVTSDGDDLPDLTVSVLYGGVVFVYWVWLAPAEDPVAVGIVLTCLTLWWASATASMANSPVSFGILSVMFTVGPLIAAATRGSSYGAAVWLIVPLALSVTVTFWERRMAYLGRTRTQTEMRTLASEVHLAFDAARDGVVVTRGGRVTRTNAAARGLLRRDDHDLQGRFLEEVLGPRASELVPGPPARLALTRADGSRRTLDVAGREGADGELIVWTLRDVTDEVATVAQLLELVRSDELTGVANRRVVLEQLTDSIGRGHPIAVLVVDVDNFKSINDAMGHGVGDAVLVQVVARLREATGGRGTVARMGGDEFAVVLVGDAVAHRREIAVRMTVLAADPVRLDIGAVPVTVSIGVASSTDGRYGSAGDLLDAADRAMYQAKRQGRAGWWDAAGPQDDAEPATA